MFENCVLFSKVIYPYVFHGRQTNIILPRPSPRDSVLNISTLYCSHEKAPRELSVVRNLQRMLRS